MNTENTTTNEAAKVLDFTTFRQKKAEEEKLARGRSPLYVSHKDNRISGDTADGKSAQDFGERVTRIRASLDRINTLMAELKKLSTDAQKNRADIKKK